MEVQLYRPDPNGTTLELAKSIGVFGLIAQSTASSASPLLAAPAIEDPKNKVEKPPYKTA